MRGAVAAHSAESYESPFQLRMVVLATMVGVLMQALDSTIANVALPYMQGGLGASRDQVTWVLTSYIIAAAIMTGPIGWIATRYGKKNVLLVSMMGFTVTSMLCGAAQSIEQIVLFRLLQGAFGAALSPVSQAILLDLYPPQKRGPIMAVWGMGVMVGPIVGPTLGGILTDAYSWRWVFYVNVPFGIASILGLWLFFKDTSRNQELKFDWFGFAVFALGLGAIQLMLDRGTDQGWFSANEIIIELVIGGVGLYLFVVHLLTAKNPFVPPKLFSDRNFLSGMAIMCVIGVVMFGSAALLPPYLQTLGGYTVTQTGLLMAPRGIGTALAMVLAGRIAMRVDPRLIMSIGAAMISWSVYQMTEWTPSIEMTPLAITTFVQGAGLGLLFLPVQLTSFATLPPWMRTDSTAFLNLIRNVGAAAGVSITSTVLASSVQTLHSQLAAYASPFNRALGVNAPSMYFNPQIPFGLAGYNSLIEFRAQVQAYANDYKLIFFMSLPMIFLIWAMRKPAPPAPTKGALEPAE